MLSLMCSLDGTLVLLFTWVTVYVEVQMAVEAGQTIGAALALDLEVIGTWQKSPQSSVLSL
jgi:hypothetical protein